MRSLLPLLFLLGCEEAQQPLCANGDCTQSCDPADPCCAPIALTEEECGEDVAIADGWDDAAGSGSVFVLNALAIGHKERGYNLDGLCDDNGCVDNVLSAISNLGNDQLRQSLLGGEMLVLVEVTGLVNG